MSVMKKTVLLFCLMVSNGVIHKISYGVFHWQAGLTQKYQTTLERFFRDQCSSLFANISGEEQSCIALSNFEINQLRLEKFLRDQRSSLLASVSDEEKRVFITCDARRVTGVSNKKI
jgi:hypothetical protein